MRKAKRDEIARSAAVQDRLTGVKDAVFNLCDAVDQLGTDLGKKIDAIQPARVDLTQEMADDIVRKIHGPLTISQEFSETLRQLAKYHDWYQMLPFGYGGDGSGRIELRIKTDGTLHLQITDVNGAPLWQGTFVPPGFGT